MIVRSQIKRRYVLAFFQKLLPCLVGTEACASSHHWSRELKALGHTHMALFGHATRPSVKPIGRTRCPWFYESTPLSPEHR